MVADQKLASGTMIGTDFVELGPGLGNLGRQFGHIGLVVEGVDDDQRVAGPDHAAIGEIVADRDDTPGRQGAQFNLAPGDYRAVAPQGRALVEMLDRPRRHGPGLDFR